MTVFISSLEIDGFRALGGLKIHGLGKVNLVTGKNISGKSTLLEAIRILATGGSLRTLYEILNYREELASLQAHRALPSLLRAPCHRRFPA